MFVKKLVEKATGKTASSNGLRPEDVNPRLVFHYGIPAGSNSLAYDPIQKILAISTKDGRIKLLGRDNTQALLQSDEPVPSKFLQFLENQGILLNITIQNHIEVWDIARRQLSYVFTFQEDITSFTVMQQSFYMYVGDCLGNITVLKLDQKPCHLVHMQYNIPFSESHGTITEVADDIAVMYALPQPMAESRRVLIIFKDGLISLWGIQESKVMFITGGNMLHTLRHELKKVVSACWACPFGSKVVVGYSSGEIFLWSIPKFSDLKTSPVMDKKDSCAAQNIPLIKLNLGYKLDKVPVSSLRWVFADGRASRLYVNGVSDLGSTNSFQVIILNENTESRTIKLVLPLPEACLDMAIVSSSPEQNKHKQKALILLLKSGHLCVYNDSEIENYLLQSQSKSPPSLPRQVLIKIPFSDSGITVSQYVTGNSDLSSSLDEDYMLLAKKFPSLLPMDMKEKDGNILSSTRFCGFAKTNNLYITGHHDGAINFWDVSCPLMLPILSIKPQNEYGHSSSDVPVTALYFDVLSQILVSGDQRGSVRIFKFKTAEFSENIVSFLQAKQGCNYTIRTVKLNGAILSIGMNPTSRHLAIGTDEGYVSVVQMEGTNMLYQKYFPSESYPGIISLQFEKCYMNDFEKNALLVARRDSSVFALEEETGNALANTMIHPKKPSRALLMQILDGPDTSVKGSHLPNFSSVNKGNAVKDALQMQSLVLLCSEKSVRLYSLIHVTQGIKKVFNKKKLHGSCCWASTFYCPNSDIGLVLVFASGKVEIRSLPELTLLKETLLRGFTFSTIQPSSNFNGALCSSSEGELVGVNGDQEIFFLSLLIRKDIYRFLDSICQIYKTDLVAPQEGPSSVMTTHKEKKMGIFSAVMRDIKGNKTKQGQETETVDSGAVTAEELSAIFSTANFLLDSGSINSIVIDEDNVELNIDDIELEDPKERPKGQNFAMLNKQKLGKKLQTIKGKLKSKTFKKADTSAKEEHEDEKAGGTVDQIKKKYGYSMSSESSNLKMAENKLNENSRKLQGIGMRTTQMQETASSFSSMAKQLLRTTEQEKRIS